MRDVSPGGQRGGVRKGVVKEFASRLKTYDIQTEKVNTTIQVKTAGSPGESGLKLPV